MMHIRTIGQVCRLTWNTFRDHCIFEYEVPKWDGDLGQPNVYVPVAADMIDRKIELLQCISGASVPSSGSMRRHFSVWLG